MINFVKKGLFFQCTFLFLFILFVQNSFSQNTPQSGLREGVKARIGKGQIRDIALSPDNTQLAVATDIGIWLYNVRTGTEIAFLTGHKNVVTSVAYSPDGKTLASIGYAENIHLWDPSTQQQKATFKYGNSYAIAYSPNGRMLAVGGLDGVDLLDAQTGDQKLSIPGQSVQVKPLAFSSDGRTLATTGVDVEAKTIGLWNARTGKLRQIFEHSEPIHTIVLSPDGKTLVSGSSDGMTYFWDTRTGRNTEILDIWSDTLTYSPDGSKIALGGPKGIHLLNARTLQPQQTFSGYTDSVYRMTFSSDGNTLVSASWDETLRLWDISTGSQKLIIEDHLLFTAYTFSFNGKSVAILSNTGDEILFWNTSSGRLNKAFDAGMQVSDIEYAPNNNTLALVVRAGDSQIQLVNFHTGNVRKTIPLQTDSLTIFRFSPDGKFLAGGGKDGRVRLWNAQTGKLGWTVSMGTEGSMGLVFSPDSKFLAGSINGRFRLWNAQTGKLGWTVSTGTEGSRALAFSPDGKILAGGSWDKVHLWDAQNGELKQILDGGGLSLAYSGDGKTLASGNWRNIHLWDAHTGERKQTLVGPSTYINGLRFTSNDSTLVSVSWQAVILLWDLNRLPELVAEDVNLDGVVDVRDLLTVASSFGESVTKEAYPNPDVNRDGVVNRRDILRVITLLETSASAPSVSLQGIPGFTAETLQRWIDRAKQLNNTEDTFKIGIRVLEELLATLGTDTRVTPAETALLANYPNPFNPETWIPYHLADASDVEMTIFDASGNIVRRLTLGHQAAGYYTNRERAAYWDGRNALGERVASGVYFYTLTTASDFSATRKMVILK